MSIEAMKQMANYIDVLGGDSKKYRQVIEQAEKQEPVAWQVMVEDEAMKEFPIKDMAHDWCVKQKLSGSPYSYWIRPLYATPQPQEFVCSTGLCRFTLTQTGVGIGERGMQAYEEAKKRGWVGISDEMEMPKQEPK